MNSREFVHRWAQGDVDWAHGNGKGRRSGNLSVAANTETRAVRLYSYAEHIASVILTPGTEERRKVILIESRPGRSSNTTSKHLRMAFDAAPSICFRVPHVEPSSREQHINNAQYLLSVARELYRRSGRARAMKTQLVLDAQNSYNDSIKYAELFGVQDMFNISREPLDVPEKLNSALEAAWGGCRGRAQGTGPKGARGRAGRPGALDQQWHDLPPSVLPDRRDRLGLPPVDARRHGRDLAECSRSAALGSPTLQALHQDEGGRQVARCA